MYLVAGATGNVGSELVRALAGAGQPVRALTRSAGRDWPDGVEEAVGDLNDPSTLTGAFEGVRGVFLLSGYADMPGLLDLAKRSGVERVVLLSSSSVPGGDLDNAVARYHIESEQVVRSSGLDWTMLRPSSFMTGTLDWAPQLRAGDVVRVPFASVPVATIDPYDVAAVAAVALTSDGHAGQAYRLSGPESLRPADRLRILGEVLGRELVLQPLSDAEARADMTASGMPAPYVEAFLSFFADGTLDESPVLSAVEDLTGRPPGSFKDWATLNAGRFGA
jgi:uncharacterized protein YbjT (DUF2867 family)